ncbi:MAG: aquaporin family protein [Gemmatimonadetes bacterium]|nr:aquaporin family protein [Gemmatimonadota bacterium]
MTPVIGEFVGTALLTLLGCGVVANVVLRGTKGHGGGWIVITLGWAMAVFVAVVVASRASGAHLNPAVSFGLAVAGKFAWASVAGYVVAQLAGALVGAALVWLMYRPHFDATDDAGAKLGVFATAPAIRNPLTNVVSEVLGTFVLVFLALAISSPEGGLGSLDALPIALVVLVVGLSLGGTTGYAINPARDLGPRIAHALLPIPAKGPNGWDYAWVPIVGPLVGGGLAGLAYPALVVG